MTRRPTGIPGLDQILDGGLLPAGVYVVQGPPGAGKTILANQACFHHAATGGRAVYVTLLAESHSRMFAHLRRMAFFDEIAIGERVYYVGGYSTLESDGLDALVTLVRGDRESRTPPWWSSTAWSLPTSRPAPIGSSRSSCTRCRSLRTSRVHGAAPDQRRARQRLLPGAHHGRWRAAPHRRAVGAATAATYPRPEAPGQRADSRASLGADHGPRARGAAANRDLGRRAAGPRDVSGERPQARLRPRASSTRCSVAAFAAGRSRCCSVRRAAARRCSACSSSPKA